SRLEIQPLTSSASNRLIGSLDYCPLCIRHSPLKSIDNAQCRMDNGYSVPREVLTIEVNSFLSSSQSAWIDRRISCREILRRAEVATSIRSRRLSAAPRSFRERTQISFPLPGPT